MDQCSKAELRGQIGGETDKSISTWHDVSLTMCVCVCSQVNVIHYNVMLNTCKSTSQAVQLIKQASVLRLRDCVSACLLFLMTFLQHMYWVCLSSVCMYVCNIYHDRL